MLKWEDYQVIIFVRYVEYAVKIWKGSELPFKSFNGHKSKSDSWENGIEYE